MFVRLMLKLFGYKMSESGECSFDKAGHGKVDFTFRVVPIKCDAEIPSSFPVFFDFVVLLKLNCYKGSGANKKLPPRRILQ